MKRFDLYERVKPVEIKQPEGQNYWGLKARFEPYERVIKAGKYWNVIQVNNNDKNTFYLEHRYTKQRAAATKSDTGLMALQEVNKSFTEYEQTPPEFQPGIQQHQPQPGPQIEQLSESEKKLNEQLARMDETIEKSNAYMTERDKAFDYELMLQRFDAIKESFSDFEQKLQAAKPRVSLEEIRQREAGQTKISNDVEEPTDKST